MSKIVQGPTGKRPKNCYARPNSPYWWCSIQVRGQLFNGSTGCKAAREAESFVAEKRRELGELADIADGKIAEVFPEGENIMLGDAIERFEKEKGFRMRSFKDMQRTGENLCIGLGIHKLVHMISHRDLQSYYSHRCGEITIRGTRRSGASVNREVAYMRQVWKHTRRNGFNVGLEPDWGGIMDQSAEKMRVRELNQDEEARLFQTLMDLYPDMVPMVEFTLLCGQRKEAASGLRWKDVNFEDREAYFVRKTKGEEIKRHTVPLTDRMLEIILEQPKVCENIFTYVCERGGKKAKDVILVKGERYPYTPYGWRKRWVRVLKEADISDFRFHDLRHTTATRILRTTGNLALAQKLLGHTNLNTTRRYAHSFTDDVRNGMEQVEIAQANKTSPECKSTKVYTGNVVPLRGLR